LKGDEVKMKTNLHETRFSYSIDHCVNWNWKAHTKHPDNMQKGGI